MAVLRPGIGEVQIDPVDLSLPEYLVNIFGIHADEFQIGKLIFLHFLDRTEQDTGIFFNAHIVDLRIWFGEGMQETSLSHTDLDMNGVIVTKDLMPGSGAAFQSIFRYHVRTFCDHFMGAGNIA